MNKEEILQRSRLENQNKDIVELEVINQASSIAVKIGILVCCFLSVVEVIAKDTINYSCWIIYFSMLATIFGIKYIKLKRKHERILTGLFLVCFIIMVIFYVRHLMGIG